MLNHAGKGGRGMGNSAGVAGLLFSSLDSAIGSLRDGRRDLGDEGERPVEKEHCALSFCRLLKDDAVRPCRDWL